jgi:hypothetical protein
MNIEKLMLPIYTKSEDLVLEDLPVGALAPVGGARTHGMFPGTGRRLGGSVPMAPEPAASKTFEEIVNQLRAIRLRGFRPNVLIRATAEQPGELAEALRRGDIQARIYRVLREGGAAPAETSAGPDVTLLKSDDWLVSHASFDVVLGEA